MIAILSSLFGVLSGILPNFFKMMEIKNDHKHEIELTKLKMEAASKGLELTAMAEDAKADASEGNSVRLHDTSISNNNFLETLRASVRPVITYAFFFLFCGIKITAATFMFNNGYNAIDVLNAVWDVYTMAIFGSIIGFWFGSRAMTKLTDMYAKGPQSYKVIPSQAQTQTQKQTNTTTQIKIK